MYYRELPPFKPEEILVYLRKSRADDPSMTVEEVLENHTHILNEWIERNLDEPIAEENWYKEIVSGEKLSDRIEMQKILNRMASPNIKYILCKDCSRLSRGDLEDCGRLMKLLRYTHTKVITPYKVFDLEDEYDRRGFESELKQGNEYLEYYKKIQRQGVALSVSSGNFIGGQSPYGYNKIKITEGRKKHPTLEINEDEAKVVRMVFDWYGNEGIGAQAITNRLNDMGLRARSGKRWTKASIRTMLENEHYLGKIRYYHRATTYDVVGQDIIKKRKRSEDYKVYEGKHEAIIDEELFYRIQNKRAAMPKYRLDTTLKNPLASIMYCQCGAVMSYKAYGGKPRFVCEEQRNCHTPSVEYNEVINSLCDALKDKIEDFSVLTNETNEDLIRQQEEYIALLEKKLVEAENKEISIWEKYSEGMPKPVFEKLKAKIEEEKSQLEKALENAKNEMPEKKDYQQQIILFHEAIDLLRDDCISAEAKNKLLRTIVKKAIYSRGASARMSKAEAEEKGIVTRNGWYMPSPKLDVETWI